MAITISYFTIKDYEGIRRLDCEPGNVNIIEGGNGTGKTSVLNAIRMLFLNSSPRSQWVHGEENYGMLLAELSNGWRLSRKVKDEGRTGGAIDLVDSEGNALSSPQTRLKNMVADLSFNPISFFNLRGRKQAELLLKLVPVSISREELIRLSGGELRREVNYGDHPLVVLPIIREELIGTRRDVNRYVRDAKSTRKNLRKDVPLGWDSSRFDDTNLQELIQELSEINVRNADRKRLDDKIEDLESELVRLKIKRDSLGSVEPTSETEETISAYQDQSAIRQKASQVDKLTQQIAEGEERSKSLTALIEEIRQKPAELLEGISMPLPEMEINEDGEIVVAGRPVSALSSGERLKLAVELATHEVGELPVLLCDNFETLSRSNQHLLIRLLHESGVQAFIARVEDSELTVITDYQPDDEIPAELFGSNETDFDIDFDNVQEIGIEADEPANEGDEGEAPF